MGLFEFTASALNEIGPLTFEELSIAEEDLQRVLRDEIGVLFPPDEQVMLLTEKFRNWSGSQREIDLLAVDSSANLIVIELKKTLTGGHMELQALRYAAMVNTMTFDQAVDAHSAYCRRRGKEVDAEAVLLDFFDVEEPSDVEFGTDVRIVLVSREFSTEITTAALWLNSRKIEVRCVRLVPFADHAALQDGRVLLSVQQIIPLPEAEEYQIGVREKAAAERDRESGERQDRCRQFWSGVLERAAGRSDLHKGIAPPTRSSCFVRRNGYHFAYAIGRGSCRVAVGINRRTSADAQRDFEFLLKHKSDIEKRFGEPLEWEPTNGRKRAGIVSRIAEPDYWDFDAWPRLQEVMAERMQRLYEAVRPLIEGDET